MSINHWFVLRALGAAAILCHATSAAAQQQWPEGPGKDVTLQICSNCHAADIVMAHRQSRDEWVASIQKMIAAGAMGTEEQFTAVLDYLTKNFGPQAEKIRVNQASATELEAAFALTTKESAAVVKYRTDHGPFKALDDFKKVPDLDFKKIEGQKDRIAF